MTDTSSNIIVAGRSVGQTELGSNGAVCLAKLGEPDARDDAMGRYSSIWVSRKEGGKKDTLFIYYVRNEDRNIEPPDGATLSGKSFKDNLGNVYLEYSQEILRLATTESVNAVLRENGIDP